MPLCFNKSAVGTRQSLRYSGASTPLGRTGTEHASAGEAGARAPFLSTTLRKVAATLALLSSLALPNAGAAAGPTILTCTNLVSGASWQIRIDFAQRTVDSNPAQISSTEISWHDAKDGGNYELDRKSGALTVIFASSTGGYFLHDRCAHSVR